MRLPRQPIAARIVAIEFERIAGGKPFDIDVRWQFGSGLPYSRALGFDGFMIVDGDLDVFRDAGNRRVIYEEPYNGTLPTYHRLDLTWRRAFDKSWGRLTPYLNLVNIYNQRNVLFYFFQYEETPPTRSGISMFPVLPTIGLEISF